MATIIAFREVDDVDHWLHSPKRQEFFGAAELHPDDDPGSDVRLLIGVRRQHLHRHGQHSEVREAAGHHEPLGAGPEH